MAAGPRIQHLENRLNQAEQSNRALLEDLTRLQQEMKLTVRQNAQGLAEQQQHVQKFDMTLRNLAAKLQQLEPRLGNTEKAMSENKAQMQQLVAHTKNVANAVSMGQQDMAMRKDASMSHIQELKSELQQQAQTKGNMERLMMTLKQEMAQMKNEIDSQKGTMQGLNQSVQMQMRMRDEPRAPTVMADTGLSDQVRQQLEGKIMEMARLVRDIEDKVEAEMRKKQITDQQISSRINDLQGLVSEQAFKRPSQMRDYNDMPNGVINGGMSEAEKARLQAKMSEVADDVTKTVNMKEQRIREEMITKIKDMEEMILEQQEVRMKRERTIREDFEDSLEITRESQAEELRKLRDAIKKEGQKHFEAVKEVDEAVGILEQQIESINTKMDKTIAAEVQSRKEDQEAMEDKLEDCEDRLRSGLASIQVALGTVGDGTKAGDINKIRKVMDEQVGEVREALMNNLEDIEQRTSILTEKINEHDKLLNNRPIKNDDDDDTKEVEVDEKISEKLEKLEFSQERLKRTMEQLQSGDGEVSDAQLASVISKIKNVENDMKAKLGDEVGIRSTQVHKLRLELHNLQEKNMQPNNINDEEIEHFKNDMRKKEISIKKLSEAIFVVKTVLNRRISNEMSDRKNNLRSLKGDVARVGNRIGDNLFIKGGERNGINTWSLHTLIRWMRWKERWMRVLYEDPKKKKKSRSRFGRSQSRGNNNNKGRR